MKRAVLFSPLRLHIGSYRADLARLLPAEPSKVPPEGELASARLLEALVRGFGVQRQARFDDLRWKAATWLLGRFVLFRKRFA